MERYPYPHLGGEKAAELSGPESGLRPPFLLTAARDIFPARAEASRVYIQDHDPDIIWDLRL
jgi:hypothetical protein